MLSKTRINRLKAQGYLSQSDQEISELAFGNRFAFILCGSIVAIGVITANIPVLIAMNMVAFGGVILKYHPFDYIYNNGMSSLLDKSKLLPRSKQLKFACTIATLWILSVILCFYYGYILTGLILGGMLISVAAMVSSFGLCIPSIIYNFLLKNS